MLLGLDEVLKGVEDFSYYTKMKCLDDIMLGNIVRIVWYPDGKPVSIRLFKVKEGYLTIWSNEKKFRKIKYQDLFPLKKWMKSHQNGTKDKVQFVQQAIDELEEKYKIKIAIGGIE